MIFNLPYGKQSISLELNDKNINGVLVSNLNSFVPESSGYEIVKQAIDNPIGTEKIENLARGKKNVCIICSDHTRPVPSKIIIPLMLERIRQGNPNANITILIATGLHRGTTKDELVSKFGEKIVKEENIVIHDCDDTDNLVDLGELPSGGRLIVNKIALDADLLVSEGFIEPHFFAGFSGGRKSVLPGVCARETVMFNHNAGFIANERARTGILDGNPVHTDMVYAAKKAKLAFIVNVVINAKHEPVYAVAGDVEKAHLKGVEFLNQMCRVKAKPSDIVISTNGGYPLDQNIYQAVKGMSSAEMTVKDGGCIIMVAASNDGHGGKAFYETFKNCESIQTLMDKFLKTKPLDTEVDQWQSQILARVMLKATVIYVSSCPKEMVEDMKMVHASSIEEAIKKAQEILGKKEVAITVIPDGVAVIVEQ